jgi:N6-L-threonylcarbamoyladenine synthase
VGVHHLLGHLNAARFAAPDLPFPALVLLVSGGHTHLYLAKDWTSLQLLQKTRDDAAGEAFDKTARMLNLGYPGGPVVDACARAAARAAEPFTPPKFRDGKASWSFSGLKTAVKLRVEREPRLATAGADDPAVQGLCRSLQEAISAWLLKPVPTLAEEHGARSLILSGGVACNSRLRADAAVLAARTGLALAIPEPRLCTDNGAMIAAAGALLAPETEPWGQNADADLKLA